MSEGFFICGYTLYEKLKKELDEKIFHKQISAYTLYVVSSPDQILSHVLQTSGKIGSGHVHWENWGQLTYGCQ